MKVAFTCQAYPPMVSGAALVLQRLVEGIADSGHSVMVLSASDRGFAYQEEIKGGKIMRLKSFPNPLRVDQSLVIWSNDEIVRELKGFQPDILHTHDPLNFGVSALHAAQKLCTPFVFTIHQLPWFITTYLPIRLRVKQFLERGIWSYSSWFMRHCAGLITPSKTIADIVDANTGFMPKVISNGVDLDVFNSVSVASDEGQQLCQKYGLCPDHPVILFVGRIDPDKKVDLVVRAAAKVIQETDAQLFIVGDGKVRHDLIRLSHSLGIHQNCFFPGFINKHGDLPGIYRLASVFVIASEIEVQSSVVLEAAASGLPVVTVRASSMPELIIDGVNGYLVPPGDLDILADRIKLLIKDQTKAKIMGRAARLRAESHSNKRFIHEHILLYRSVLQTKKYNINQMTMA